MTDETKQSVLDALMRLGVPCVVLAAFLWMARESAIALHHSVVEPVVQSHVEFLDATRKTLTQLGETQKQQAETLREISDGQREIQKTLGKVTQN